MQTELQALVDDLKHQIRVSEGRGATTSACSQIELGSAYRYRPYHTSEQQMQIAVFFRSCSAWTCLRLDGLCTLLCCANLSQSRSFVAIRHRSDLHRNLPQIHKTGIQSGATCVEYLHGQSHNTSASASDDNGAHHDSVTDPSDLIT